MGVTSKMIRATSEIILAADYYSTHDVRADMNEVVWMSCSLEIMGLMGDM
jgi:hypothetical protein